MRSGSWPGCIPAVLRPTINYFDVNLHFHPPPSVLAYSSAPDQVARVDCLLDYTIYFPFIINYSFPYSN